MDVAVVGVAMQPGVPSRLLRVEADGLEERWQDFAEQFSGLLRAVAVLDPVFLLKADHAVPDAGTGGSKLLPEFFLLLYGDRSIRVENTAGFLAVVGVGEVIARFSVCLADAFVHVVDVIVLLGGGIELSALAIWLVVMEPHEHVRRCHRLSARRLPCSKDGLEGNQVSPP